MGTAGSIQAYTGGILDQIDVKVADQEDGKKYEGQFKFRGTLLDGADEINLGKRSRHKYRIPLLKRHDTLEVSHRRSGYSTFEEQRASKRARE